MDIDFSADKLMLHSTKNGCTLSQQHIRQKLLKLVDVR